MKKFFKIQFKLLTAIAIIGFLGSCKEDEVPDITPVADFTTEVNDLVVTFTNTSADGQSFAWDFGDGNTSTDVSPTHTYEAYGEYDVKLTATSTDGTMADVTKEVVVADVCDLRTPDPENLIVGGQFEGCDADSWTAIVANEGGAASPATHGPAKWEFGYTDYNPADGDGGALYIFPDNDASEIDEATLLYQEIIVPQDGLYQFSGLMKASGGDEMNSYFFQFFMGQTVPTNNMDYSDNNISGFVDFTDFAFGIDLPATDGPIVHSYSPPATTSDDQGRFNLDAGTYYFGIKFGKGGGSVPAFGDGIAVDDLRLERVGDKETLIGQQVVMGGGFDDESLWTHFAGGTDPKVDLTIGAIDDALAPDASVQFGGSTALYVVEPTAGDNSSSTIFQNMGPVSSGKYKLEAFLKIDADIDNGGTVDNGWFEIVVSTLVPEDGVGYNAATGDTENYDPEKWVTGYNEFECGTDWNAVLGVADGNPDNAFGYDVCALGLANSDGEFDFSNPDGDDVYIVIKTGTFEGTLGAGVAIDFLALTRIE